MRTNAEIARIAGAQGARLTGRTATILALAWGLLSGFSAAMSDDQAAIVQGLALVGVVIGCLLSVRANLAAVAWTRSATGLLIALHVFAAICSALINGASAASTIRYVALLPTFSVLLLVVRSGDRAIRGFQFGLTMSGVIFVIVHLAYLEPAGLMDPTYRISLFLNTNGVGFIGAMTAISLIALPRPEARTGRALRILGVLACAVVCFATKSRTAFLALAGGFATHAGLDRRRRKVALLLLLAVVLGLVLTGKADALLGRIDELFMLHDRDRSIESGTSRYDAWAYVVSLWLQNPFFGLGPGGHEAFVNQALGISSAHNGVLANLADVGLVGTLPLIVLIARSLWKGKRHPRRDLALPLVIAGIIESGAEIIFFSMGNPGSLLFMFGLSLLGEPAARDRSQGGAARAKAPLASAA
jgi:O-antigen ligase